MKAGCTNALNFYDISQIISETSFATMAKPVGALCNLNCSYCYYLKREPSGLMSEVLLEEYILQYISSQQSDKVTFCWHGGEPTLAGIDYFRRAVELQNKYSHGKEIINTFQTNGTLIDREWCRFFKENGFLVGLSIDGPAYIHDSHRKWNRSSCEAAIKAAVLFNETGVEFNTLTTINNLSIGKGREIYQFLRYTIGSSFMQFLPVAEPFGPDGNAAPWSVTPEGYGEFLIDIFDTWVRSDVGKVFVQIFEATLAQWCGYPASVCTLGEYCSDSLTVEHNGDVYPCDHFAKDPHKLGNITQQPLDQIFASQKRIDFTLGKKLSLPLPCHDCRYLFACHGECPKHRFAINCDGSKGNYLCAGLKKFFAHVEPYMNRMRMLLESGRPASMIMREQIL